MQAVFVVIGVLASLGAAWAQVPQTQDATALIEIETDHLRVALDAAARVIAFTDLASSKNYLEESPGPAVARIRQAGRLIEATSLAYDNKRLRRGLGGHNAHAVIHVSTLRAYLVLEVESFTGENVEELTFFDVPLTLSGTLEDPFAACLLALNLQTRVPETPGPSARLRAMCYSRFGFAGARAAIIGAPMPALRDIMKEVVAVSPELPQSRIVSL